MAIRNKPLSLLKAVLKIAVGIILISGLTACVSQTLKAPCDAYGTGCGPKIKINQWQG